MEEKRDKVNKKLFRVKWQNRELFDLFCPPSFVWKVKDHANKINVQNLFFHIHSAIVLRFTNWRGNASVPVKSHNSIIGNIPIIQLTRSLKTPQLWSYSHPLKFTATKDMTLGIRVFWRKLLCNQRILWYHQSAQISNRLWVI